MNAVARLETAIDKGDVRDWIVALETNMRKLPDVGIGDCYPLKHNFADGMYVREIQVPKGNLVVTKIHKLAHPCFILTGDCSVLTDLGVMRVHAPYYMITPAGTKRVVYVHEDTVWVTVHRTDSFDLDAIEDEIISTSFEEFLTYQKQLEGEIL
jgi:hypothetical protein